MKRIVIPALVILGAMMSAFAASPRHAQRSAHDYTVERYDSLNTIGDLAYLLDITQQHATATAMTTQHNARIVGLIKIGNAIDNVAHDLTRTLAVANIGRPRTILLAHIGNQQIAVGHLISQETGLRAYVLDIVAAIATFLDLTARDPFHGVGIGQSEENDICRCALD